MRKVPGAAASGLAEVYQLGESGTATGQDQALIRAHPSCRQTCRLPGSQGIVHGVYGILAVDVGVRNDGL
jgi:hypothetical protein